jgi:N-succinyldiaminopimelate aminotransferase
MAASAAQAPHRADMNPNLARLQPYPFERLAALKAGLTPPADRPHIPLSIGEPKHPTPAFIGEALMEHLHGLAQYPATKGSDALRRAIAQWLQRRFTLPAGSIDPERQVLPVNGTREALFALAQCVVEPGPEARVLMPNPFYQIYEGAALLAGAEPVYLNCGSEQGYVPDFDQVPPDLWSQCQLLYVCSPGNPTGTVLDQATLQGLIERAEAYDFIIAADECYSEIYFDEDTPPAGLLQAAAAMGRDDYRRCVVFHSLSKRSNAPGLRSGFVAGDARVLEAFLRYRTYHGCAMPPAAQAASLAAWSDERHVRQNRDLYRDKFAAVLEILQPVLPVESPQGGFYLWPRLDMADTEFARELFARQHVTVLPGSYLSRDTTVGNPGERHVRMALVASREDCIEAAHRIRTFIEER